MGVRNECVVGIRAAIVDVRSLPLGECSGTELCDLSLHLVVFLL